MASFAAKLVAKRLFQENSANKQGQEVRLLHRRQSIVSN